MTVQSHDSDGNPCCIYCGGVMRSRLVYLHRAGPSVEKQVGYRNDRLFCSKHCGYTYGLIQAHFKLEQERITQCDGEPSGTSPPGKES